MLIGRFATPFLWGLAHREDPQFKAVGIDEIAAKRGCLYLPLIYQIDEGCRRLLWVGRERKEATPQRSSKTPCARTTSAPPGPLVQRQLFLPTDDN